MKRFVLIAIYLLPILLANGIIYRNYIKSDNPNGLSFRPKHFWHYYFKDLDELKTALDIIIVNQPALKGDIEPNASEERKSSIIYLFRTKYEVTYDSLDIIYTGKISLVEPEKKEVGTLRVLHFEDYRGMVMGGISFQTLIHIESGPVDTNGNAQKQLKDKSFIAPLAEPLPQNCVSSPWKLRFEGHKFELSVLKVDACKMLVTFQLPKPILQKLATQGTTKLLEKDMEQRFKTASPVLSFKVLHWATGVFDLMQKEEKVNWDMELKNYQIDDKNGKFFQTLERRVYWAYFVYIICLMTSLFTIFLFSHLIWRQIVKIGQDKKEKAKQRLLRLQQEKEEEEKLLQLLVQKEEKLKAKQEKASELEQRAREAKQKREEQLKTDFEKFLTLNIDEIISNVAIPGDLRKLIKAAHQDIKQINQDSDWLNDESFVKKILVLGSLLAEADRAIDSLNQLKTSILQRIKQLEDLASQKSEILIKYGQFKKKFEEIENKVSQQVLKPKEVRQLDYEVTQICRQFEIE